MKRTVTFAVGIGIFVAASALGVSDYSANSTGPAMSAGAAEFGLIAVDALTDEQRALLQAKYRYWSSSDHATAKLPR